MGKIRIVNSFVGRFEHGIIVEGKSKNCYKKGVRRVFDCSQLRWEYEGHFNDSEEFHGFGRVTNPDKVTYEGCFNDGKLNGRAKISSPGNFVLSGDVVEQQLQGSGTAILIKTDLKYVGKFQKN